MKHFTPFLSSITFTPGYYRALRATPNTLPGLDVLEVAQAWELDFLRGSALKYLLRAGRKPRNPELHDLQKAMEFIQRRINALGQAQEQEKDQKP
jgi:hypothetical protein